MALITAKFDVSAFANFWEVARQSMEMLSYLKATSVEFEFNKKIISVHKNDTEETLWQKYQGEKHAT